MTANLAINKLKDMSKHKYYDFYGKPYYYDKKLIDKSIFYIINKLPTPPDEIIPTKFGHIRFKYANITLSKHQSPTKFLYLEIYSNRLLSWGSHKTNPMHNMQNLPKDTSIEDFCKELKILRNFSTTLKCYFNSVKRED